MQISSFDFRKGKSLAGKYVVQQKIGDGYEGEVYIIKEVNTGIERVAKFFFPHRNEKELASKHHAKKMHKLANCPVVVQYHFHGEVRVQGQPVTYLVSQFIDGDVLSEYIESKPGKRLQPFEALHILHAIVEGLVCVHRSGEYHGDLHTDNVLIKPKGLGHEIRLIDFFNSGSQNKGTLRKEDIIDLIGILYEMIGGKKHYAKTPQQIKDIICGLKHKLILKKFPTMMKLKDHLENISWV